MSVDPDDLTPAAIRDAGGEVAFYGTPVLPGAMFMLAYIGDVPVIGLPGCVMYHRPLSLIWSYPDFLLEIKLKNQMLLKWDMVDFAQVVNPVGIPLVLWKIKMESLTQPILDC